MNIIEKLENYFNSGSTDKQNKRRLGGLLIAITAIILVLSIAALTVGGVVAAVGGIIDAFKKPEPDPNEGINTHLVEVDGADIISAATGTIVFDNSVPANMKVSKFGEDAYRPKKADGKTSIYKAYMAQGLQTEAYEAFNKLISDFHNQSSKDQTFWLEKAYDTTDGVVNGGYFANALAVDVWYEYSDETAQSGKSYAPIDNSEDFDWIFKNASKYGFVRVSNTEGERSILRYVGIAHAEYIYTEQNKKGRDTFYDLDTYLEEIKATTPDTKMSNTGAKAIGEKTTTKYYVYYTTATAGQIGKLPSDKYSYTVLDAGDGYIVTYCKAATAK